MTDDESAPGEASGVAPVFIAATVAEARRAEEILDAHGVEYEIRVQPFGRTLFGSPRQGAFFYVPHELVVSTGALLTAAGLGIGVVPPDDRKTE